MVIRSDKDDDGQDLDTVIDGDDDQGDADQGDDGDEETAEELRIRLRKLTRQVHRANREAARLRAERSTRRDDDLDSDDGIDDDDRSRSGRRGRDDDRDRDDRDRARRDKAAAALQRKLAEADREVSRWREEAMRSKVASGLAGAGADPDRIKKLARLVDKRDLEFGDDGELVGLEDQIEELREDFPELFKPKPRGRVRASGRDDDDDDGDDGDDDDARLGRRGARRGPAPRLTPGPRTVGRRAGGQVSPKTSADLIAAAITGGRQ